MSANPRSRLGRCLSSLIPTAMVPERQDMEAKGQDAGTAHVGPSQTPPRIDVREITIEHIDETPDQPRDTIDPTALKELADSIRIHGVLQPVLLKPNDGRYTLVSGHRRLRAAKLAGMAVIPAIVRTDSTVENQVEWALIENIQRKDLNPMERARAYRNYIDRFHLTHAQAAERLGEERATVSNFLRLLELCTYVQHSLSSGALSAGHAKVLAGVEDPARQERLARRAVESGASVRQLEEMARANLPPAGGAAAVAAPGHVLKSAHIVETEQELSRKLGVKLRIFPARRKGQGKIVIHYLSLDDFDRIVEKFS